MSKEHARILIWGKTAPEVSEKHIETVCTGGVREDGTPIRLYPIPFRYLDGKQQFKKYDWIKAKISKSTKDIRPESFKVDHESIVVEDHVETDKHEWRTRASIVFQQSAWQFTSMEELMLQQQKQKTSLGIVEPKEIIRVYEVAREPEELLEFAKKREKLRKQIEGERSQPRLFDQYVPPELKDYGLPPSRIRIEWKCHGPRCKTHDTQFLDWEVMEQLRRLGSAAVLAKLHEVLNLETHATKFFMGNLYLYPKSFLIGGIWYPKRAKEKQPLLFG